MGVTTGRDTVRCASVPAVFTAKYGPHVAKQEAEVLENLVAHSEFAVMATDVHGTVTLWNQAATKLFGYTPEEMLGKSMLVILPKELQDVHKRNFARLAQDRHPKYSYRLVRCYAYAKTGELRDITLAIRAIPDNGTYKILVAVESPQLHEDPVVRKNLTEHQKLLDYISPTKGAQE